MTSSTIAKHVIAAAVETAVTVSCKIAKAGVRVVKTGVKAVRMLAEAITNGGTPRTGC